MNKKSRLIIAAILCSCASFQISQSAHAVCWFCWTNAKQAAEAEAAYKFMDHIEDDLDDLEEAKDQTSDPDEIASLDRQIQELNSLWTYADVMSQMYDDLQRNTGPCPNGCGTDSDGNSIEDNPQVPESTDPFGSDPTIPSDSAGPDGSTEYV